MSPKPFLAAMLLAAPALGLLAVPAHAQSCLDQVKQLADRHGVSDVPPRATSSDSGPTTTDKLARSGGVIEPPDMSDKSVINPGNTQAYRMPTVPDVTPKDKVPDRTALQAALMAARAQAERGNEEGCLEALAKAKALSAREG